MNEIIKHLRTSTYNALELVNHVSYRHFNIDVLNIDEFNKFLQNIGINKRIKMNNNIYEIYDI